MRLPLVLVLSATGLCAQDPARVGEYVAGQQTVQAPEVAPLLAEGAATGEANAQEQARLEKETAQSAAKLADWKQKLAKATRALGAPSSRAVPLLVGALGDCSIPLRQVGSAANFPLNMRILTPGSNLETSAFERAPKAPPCEETINK